MTIGRQRTGPERHAAGDDCQQTPRGDAIAEHGEIELPCRPRDAAPLVRLSAMQRRRTSRHIASCYLAHRPAWLPVPRHVVATAPRQAGCCWRDPAICESHQCGMTPGGLADMHCTYGGAHRCSPCSWQAKSVASQRKLFGCRRHVIVHQHDIAAGHEAESWFSKRERAQLLESPCCAPSRFALCEAITSSVHQLA